MEERDDVVVHDSLPPSVSESNDKEDNSDRKNAETAAETPVETDGVKMKERIKCLLRKLKGVCCQVSFLVDRNKRLESNIDFMAETLKQNNVNDNFEVDGEKLSIEEYILKLKAGYLLSNQDSVNAGSGTDVSVTDRKENEWSFDTEDADLMLEANEDKGLSVHQINDYETQIETIKTEIEFLRATMTDAYGREQDYKILVGQLDMAESRANQKWGAFHNSVIQQWSNHCDYLQRQLGFSAVKLRETSIAYQQNGTRDENNNTVAAPSTDFEYAEDDMLNYSDQQPHQQLLTTGQEPAAIASAISISAMMTARPPMPPMSYLPPPGNTAYIPSPPPPFPLLPPCPPEPMSGKMSSACQLHRYFSNLAMIEQAQLEGRAYPPSSQPQYLDDDDEDLPGNAAAAAAVHAPRRSRAFGSGISNEQDNEEDSRQAGSTFAWKPTANPFVPDVHI